MYIDIEKVEVERVLISIPEEQTYGPGAKRIYLSIIPMGIYRLSLDVKGSVDYILTDTGFEALPLFLKHINKTFDDYTRVTMDFMVSDYYVNRDDTYSTLTQFWMDIAGDSGSFKNLKVISINKMKYYPCQIKLFSPGQYLYLTAGSSGISEKCIPAKLLPQTFELLTMSDITNYEIRLIVQQMSRTYLNSYKFYKNIASGLSGDTSVGISLNTDSELTFIRFEWKNNSATAGYIYDAYILPSRYY